MASSVIDGFSRSGIGGFSSNFLSYSTVIYFLSTVVSTLYVCSLFNHCINSIR